MKPPFSLKVFVCLVVLFALGGVCGYALAIHQVRAGTVHGRWEERWLQAIIKEDTVRLQLTKEQLERVNPFYDQMRNDLHAARDAAGVNITDAGRKLYRAVWAELTPGQRDELQKLSEERRKRWKRTPPSTQS